MEDITKIVKALEDSGVLLEGVSETIKIEVTEHKRGFCNILLVTLLGASLLGNTFAGKGIVRIGYGSKGKGIIRAGYRSKKN